MHSHLQLVVSLSLSELVWELQFSSLLTVRQTHVTHCDAGNKLTTYGGNLTIFHRAEFSGDPLKDSEVIMRGRDGTVLHYGLGAEARLSDRETRDSFMLTEAGWFVINSGSPVPATRQEFLSVLADIEVRQRSDVGGSSAVVRDLGVDTPALLGHKEPAQGTQISLLWFLSFTVSL